MNRNQTKEAAKLVNTLWPDRTTITADTIDAWTELFVDVHADDINHAIHAWAADGNPHPPTPGQLHKTAAVAAAKRRQAIALDDPGHRPAGKVCLYCGQAGRHTAWCYRSDRPAVYRDAGGRKIGLELHPQYHDSWDGMLPNELAHPLHDPDAPNVPPPAGTVDLLRRVIGRLP